MALKGKFGNMECWKEEEQKCCNCGKMIKDGETIYVCELNKEIVYCSCWNKQRNNEVCMEGKYSNIKVHTDICCTLRIKKDE